MCKKSLRVEQMNEAAIVNQAAQWASELTHHEARGPGDIENAWQRLEYKYGIPTSLLWSLRYRKPKTMSALGLARLHAAYRAECERQMRKLENDIEATKELAGPLNAVVLAAEAVVGAKEVGERKKASGTMNSAAGAGRHR